MIIDFQIKISDLLSHISLNLEQLLAFLCLFESQELVIVMIGSLWYTIIKVVNDSKHKAYIVFRIPNCFISIVSLQTMVEKFSHFCNYFYNIQ